MHIEKVDTYPFASFVYLNKVNGKIHKLLTLQLALPIYHLKFNKKPSFSNQYAARFGFPAWGMQRKWVNPDISSEREKIVHSHVRHE